MIARIRSTPDDAIGQAIAAEIMQREADGVRELLIRRDGNHVIVRGRSTSFYQWQLVIAACQAVLAQRPQLSLDCRFDVALSPAANRSGG